MKARSDLCFCPSSRPSTGKTAEATIRSRAPALPWGAAMLPTRRQLCGSQGSHLRSPVPPQVWGTCEASLCLGHLPGLSQRSLRWTIPGPLPWPHVFRGSVLRLGQAPTPRGAHLHVALGENRGQQWKGAHPPRGWEFQIPVPAPAHRDTGSVLWSSRLPFTPPGGIPPPPATCQGRVSPPRKLPTPSVVLVTCFP